MIYCGCQLVIVVLYHSAVSLKHHEPWSCIPPEGPQVVLVPEKKEINYSMCSIIPGKKHSTLFILDNTVKPV